MGILLTLGPALVLIATNLGLWSWLKKVLTPVFKFCYRRGVFEAIGYVV